MHCFNLRLVLVDSCEAAQDHAVHARDAGAPTTTVVVMEALYSPLEQFYLGVEKEVVTVFLMDRWGSYEVLVRM